MSKSATFIVLDCSPAMLDIEEGLPEGNGVRPDPNSYFCRAKNIAEILLKRKLLANRKLDYVGLLFAGTLMTELPFSALSFGKHLTLFSPLAQATLPMAQAIVDQPVSDQQCDGIAAIELALKLIMDHCKAYAYRSKTLIFLTCPSSSHSKASDRERIAKIWDTLKLNKITLAYVGCSGETPPPDSFEFESLPLLHQVATQGGGQALNYEEGHRLAIETLISSDVKLTPTFYGDLYVGDNLRLPTLGYAQSKVSSSFKFKSCHLNEPLPHPPSASLTTGETETTSNEPAAAETPIVEPCYQYGTSKISKSLINVDAEDVAQKVFDISKAIRVMGFIPREKVNRLHFMEEAMILHPRFNPEAFEVLALGMYRAKKVGIAWYVRAANASQISLGYLVACRPTSSTSSHFQFFRIPFSQDVCTSLLPSLNDVPFFARKPGQPDKLTLPRSNSLHKPLLDATEAYIKSMMLPLEGEDTEDYDPYKPASLPNPGWMGVLDAIHCSATRQPLPSDINPITHPELPPSRIPVVDALKRAFSSLTGEADG
ncbi:ATP-dependent DNA helicase yku80, variant 2 [Entomophthora muscae]|nr:ATP-dependent DNA helicase yku80, variant 2 [Entomophthora muscae]